MYIKKFIERKNHKVNIEHGTIIDALSDHNPIYINVQVNMKKQEKTKKCERNEIKVFNSKTFNKEINEIYKNIQTKNNNIKNNGYIIETDIHEENKYYEVITEAY